MALRIQLAGQVVLHGAGGVVPAERLRRSAWMALAYLAAERHRPVRRDELAEVLWGEDPPASWDTIVRGVISKLRGALDEAGAGRDAVSTAFGCYQLHLGPDAVIDVEEAAADVARAEAALAAGDARGARLAASRAADVAARQFLPGAEGAWVERRQAELAELNLRALEAVAHAASGAGDHAAAVQAAEEVIALAPLRESGHLRLISAHTNAGNRAEALRAYDRCRRLLVEEVGVSPSPAVEAAYLSLLREDVPPAPAPRADHPLPAPLVVRDTLGFVGRQLEREQLSDAWKRAVEGERQVVFVGGEPGIGKTRLVAELAAEAHEQGGRVFYGQCDEELAAPYEPLAVVVRQCLGASGEDVVARLQTHADELTRLVPELALRLSRVPRPAPDHAGTARALVADAVDALLAFTASSGPLIVILDDLHWAEGAALAVLRRLIRSSTEARVLLVATYRDTELRAGHPMARLLADTRRDAGVVRLRLGAIGSADVATLTRARWPFAPEARADELAEALHAHTRGNPFFIGEVLRHLATTSVFENGRLPDVAEVVAVVPEGVREVVTRSLLRLSPSTNSVLAEASVVGTEFDAAFLQEMGTARDDVLDALDEGVRAGLVVDVPGMGCYRFAHALVRHTIYDELGPIRRARIHRRAGQTLEHLYGREGRHVALLARHFCAGAPAGDAARAADYALAAAQAAAQQLAPEEAVVHLDAGLAALDAGRPDPERRWQLLMALALAHKRVGDSAQGWREATSAAAELAREHGWLQRLVQVALVRSMTGPYTWRDPTGAELCHEALAAIGDSDPAARALLLCATLAIQRGRLTTDGEAVLQEAHALARRSGDGRALHQVLILRCIQLKGSGTREHYVELRRTACAAQTLESEPPPPDDRVAWWLHLRTEESVRRAWLHRADASLALGDRGALDADLDRLETTSVAHGDTFGIALAAARRAHLALLVGRYEDVERFCDGVSRFAPGLGAAQAELISAQYRFQLGFERGRGARLLEELRVVANRHPWVPLRPLLALGRFESGRADSARQEIDAMLAQRESNDLWRPAWLLPLVDICARLGDAALAERLYGQLLPYAGVFAFPALVPIHPGPVDHFLGVLAVTLGGFDEADDHFATALALEESMAARPVRAHTLHWLARLRLRRRRRGDQDEAGRLLAEVLETTRALGMTRLAGAVRDLTGDL